MYTIAGDTFYTAADDKEVLIKAFINSRPHYYMRYTPKSINAADIMPESTDVYREMGLALYNRSPDTLAFAINQETIYDTQLLYEEHWMNFLREAIRIESRIVKFDSVGAYGALTMGGDVDPKYESFLSTINGASYLVISRHSGIVTNDGQGIQISDRFIQKIKSIFLETSVTDSSISIKYAPLMDTSGIYTLNRILHLYM